MPEPPPTRPDLELPPSPSDHPLDRLRDLAFALNLSPGRILAALAALAALGAVLGTGWLLTRAPAPPAEESLPHVATIPESVPSTTLPRAAAHAAGGVVAPGLYLLEPGARVADLVDAAGGLVGDADTDRINLAALVDDGARVYVPRVGETDIPAVVGVSTPTDAASGSGPAALVDVNTAGLDELDTLPGVGPATATAIIEHRDRAGPFGSVDDLIAVRGIGEAKLADLRDLVSV